MKKFHMEKTFSAKKDTPNGILLSNKFEKLVNDYNYSIENDVLSLSRLKHFIKERDKYLHLKRLHQFKLPVNNDFVDNIAIEPLLKSTNKKLGDMKRDLKCCEDQIMNLEYAIMNTSSSQKYIKMLIKDKDMWNSLKIRKMRKTTGINGFFFKLNKLFFLGVKFHEYSHYLTSKIFGIPQ